ncbi:protein-L-isoaspartate O-methyltransferase [Mesorhizobium sp. KR1-2]|uniref:protein-L-isoaspartate O-methyltransferase family protein n=1 Tax=Mesorhizobium sp. KR1-2 TaxID=3156609 RepID=UPI0032B53093
MYTDFSEQRVKMVDGQVRTTDVTDAGILEAMLTVPREEFVGAKRRELAYIDDHIELAPAQAGKPARYLMQPSPFAKMAQLADIRRTDFVLDVGCGTGYSSAVLSRLASSVVALESDQALAETAAATLSKLGYDNVAVVQGALAEGYKAEAPYDVIFLEGSVDKLPQALFDQLKEGGRLIAVQGQGNAGVARLFLKATGIVTGRGAFNAAIRPLPGFEHVNEFEF